VGVTLGALRATCAGDRRWRAALVAASLVAASGCDSISREELRCEEAISKVMSCCPGLPASPVVCEYRQSTISPFVFTFPAVDCLVGLSCAELQARGTCTWAASPSGGEACP
jgi:hypothetical protein